MQTCTGCGAGKTALAHVRCKKSSMLRVLQATPNGMVLVAQFDTRDGIYDCAWSEVSAIPKEVCDISIYHMFLPVWHSQHLCNQYFYFFNGVTLPASALQTTSSEQERSHSTGSTVKTFSNGQAKHCAIVCCILIRT